MYSEEYYKWIKWCKENKKDLNLTSNQANFAEFLFKNKEELIKWGDLEKIFKSVRKFLRD